MSKQSPPNRAAIEENQLSQLRNLLQALLASNRFYQAKLSAAGVGSDCENLQAFRTRVPFTTKTEITEDQAAHPPYGTNFTFPIERYTRLSQTSATSGPPLKWLDTPESWDWMLQNWTRVYEAAGVHTGDRVFFAFSFGPFLGFWTAFESAARLGCLCVPGGGMSTNARLQNILANRINVLCCTPTYALRMAEVAAEENIDLRQFQVRVMIVAGEPGGSIPAMRSRIEQQWPGARVFDHHGMTEVGPVSYPCPQQPDRLHIMENAYLAEVIDPQNGQPIEPGATGELVLTTLGRTGSPLLRYRTGDLVKPATDAPCPCGSYEMALEGGILGRTDDMISIRGVNVYPSAVDQIIRGVEGVAEYRVEIQPGPAMTELTVLIEPSATCTDQTRLASIIEKALRDALSLRIPVTLTQPGALPRFEMKAKRWVQAG